MAWNKEETLHRSEMQALQLARLQDTVAYVYTHNSHYHRQFEKLGLKPEDIRSLADLKLLPFTTKQDLRDH